MEHKNHYEAAFTALLNRAGLRYWDIDDSRRGCIDGVPLKSLDFVVRTSCGQMWLIDVKGRRYPGGPAERPKRHFENWATRDDLQGGLEWVRRCAPHFQPIFVFSYWLTDAYPPRFEAETVWSWQGRTYLLRAVTMTDYVQHMHTRSPKWNTVCVPTAAFRRLARPLHSLWPELAEAISSSRPTAAMACS